jgi:putative heme iron utilization protein
VRAESAVVDDEHPEAAAAHLISAQPCLALATIDDAGQPRLSSLPFAVDGAAFAIVASRLASHTASLLARRGAAIMLVDAPAPAADAYARPRLSIDVSPQARERGSAPAGAIWSALLARHGETVALLGSLPDFEAIALVPVRGRLILGFASAHDLDAAALARVLRRAVP